MDEDLSIIDRNTRFEKIKIFLIKNKKIIIIFSIISISFLFIFFGYKELNKKKKLEISNFYNSTIIDYSESNKLSTIKNLQNIIKTKDATYSPLSLYFIIDNDLILEKDKVNNLFDILIFETRLETEIKNLIIYKKGLYNADSISENELINILNPLINSESIWKSHALYLMAEYFYSKNEKQKSKEFFQQIMNIEYANQDIIKKTKKRLNRDLSE
ncbi:hypothetical protein N9U81_01410 [Candidatus Pelagibacter sp.]|nr:hypothetical protein [Candidatus Pelagibacter sp.]|tara:strand:- start:1838 stop:2482 length:645 start_codon:yes stop_codon:yes gene_type:complete